MSKDLLSWIGLNMVVIPVVLAGVNVLFPAASRWVSNFVLPFFGPGIPDKDKALTKTDQLTMLDAMVDAAPKGKELAAKDYVFVTLFQQRQGGIVWLAVAVAAIYGHTLGLALRNPLHLLFGVIAVFMAIANANQAGIPMLGIHPRVSKNGRNVGILFTPFWIFAAYANLATFFNTL